jgi:hypothetical protein
MIPKGVWLIFAAGVLLALQQPRAHVWREYPGTEYNDFPLPADYQEKTEWAFARLMYPNMDGVHGRRRWFSNDWREGGRGISWTVDYPRSDRHFSEAVRRLTRIHARSVEEPVNLEEGGQFDWPWLYAVEVGHWNLSDTQVKAMREYLDRGGFFMCDDFHGSDEWDVFVASFKKIFPDRQIVDIDGKDAIFHSVFDLDERYQVPGMQYTQTGRIYEKDGVNPEFRAVYDDRGRIVAAICHNMDLGDSWENADEPTYPQKFSALGIRIGINYIVYAMSH